MAFHPPLSLKNLYTEPLDILPLSRKDTLALSSSLSTLNSLSPSLSPPPLRCRLSSRARKCDDVLEQLQRNSAFRKYARI
jgi:hypothetical protein